MNGSFLNIPFAVWGMGALVIAGIFVMFVPRADVVNKLHGTRFVIVRWFHSLVWLLLALSFFVRGMENESISGLANPLAALAGITYLIYMSTFFTTLRP
ncbi:MAG: hypothetical protein R3E39_19520 [Anaerolineae bacterium]